MVKFQKIPYRPGQVSRDFESKSGARALLATESALLRRPDRRADRLALLREVFGPLVDDLVNDTELFGAVGGQKHVTLKQVLNAF